MKKLWKLIVYYSLRSSPPPSRTLLAYEDTFVDTKPYCVAHFVPLWFNKMHIPKRKDASLRTENICNRSGGGIYSRSPPPLALIRYEILRSFCCQYQKCNCIADWSISFLYCIESFQNCLSILLSLYVPDFTHFPSRTDY